MSFIVRQGHLEDDKAALLYFWEEQGTKPLDKKFRWMYESNPYGRAIFWLLIDENNQEIVGSSTLFPREIVVHGETYRAGIAGDLLIHKNHRTMGPALMLMRKVFENAKNAGFDIVYTLPNRDADLLAKRVGYKEIATLSRYVNLFKVKQQLVKRGVPSIVSNILSPVLDGLLMIVKFKIWGGVRPRLKFAELDKFDHRLSSLWEKYGLSFSVLPGRSVAYMNWKYFNDPDDLNKVYAAFSDDEEKMLGCIVYCEDDNSVEIRELLSVQNTKIQKYIIFKFLRYIQETGVESVLMNVIENNPLSEVVLECGFTLRSQGRSIRYACFNNAIDQAALNDRDKWYFVMSDEDT